MYSVHCTWIAARNKTESFSALNPSAKIWCCNARIRAIPRPSPRWVPGMLSLHHRVSAALDPRRKRTLPRQRASRPILVDEENPSACALRLNLSTERGGEGRGRVPRAHRSTGSISFHNPRELMGVPLQPKHQPARAPIPCARHQRHIADATRRRSRRESFLSISPPLPLAYSLRPWFGASTGWPRPSRTHSAGGSPPARDPSGGAAPLSREHTRDATQMSRLFFFCNQSAMQRWALICR